MKRIIISVCILIALFSFSANALAKKDAKKKDVEEKNKTYSVGVDDVLDIVILQPEELTMSVVVAPDGSINLPYVGNVYVEGLNLEKIQRQIEEKLSDGYMKYPIVSVTLRENRSKKFFIYGEVIKPGAYPLDDQMTVLKAISQSGGFNKFGSTSRVKILRSKGYGLGYETKKINMGAAMGGRKGADIYLKPDDIIVVSEGIF